MGVRDFLLRVLAAPAQRTHTIAASPRLPLRNRTLAPGCRTGMWVRWEGRTGIAQPGPNGLIEVHVVDEAGNTVFVTHQPWSAMRQATMSEIPAARRPDAATLHRLGYLED